MVLIERWIYRGSDSETKARNRKKKAAEKNKIKIEHFTKSIFNEDFDEFSIPKINTLRERLDIEILVHMQVLCRYNQECGFL